ncbi:MAG: protein-L-isoaspartate(D-aspartate) O-methyltransferase [Phycisphaerae bacterium]|jgi:protein-L-isoaspartate(D-aspartate) O-methyltransferase
MQAGGEHDERATERERMVREQLERRGIRSTAVLEAMRRIPRERFVLASYDAEAYADSALAVACGQTISQPYMVARMTELLTLKPADRVLEIGTGTGYQAAVLALLARHVYTIERHEPLMREAQQRLADLGLTNVSYHCGDGSVGWPDETPFDAIMVTAGAPQIPDPLCGQLADGGRLVVPVGGQTEQTLTLVRRMGAELLQQEHLRCRFVRLIGQAGWTS